MYGNGFLSVQPIPGWLRSVQSAEEAREALGSRGGGGHGPHEIALSPPIISPPRSRLSGLVNLARSSAGIFPGLTLCDPLLERVRERQDSRFEDIF